MKNKAKAFTLLELLIVLSLFSIAMVVVSSVFRTGLWAWQRGEGDSQVYQELRIALDRMAQEFRNSAPYGEFPFEGRKDMISFTQPRASRFSPIPEWIHVTYQVIRQEGTDQLIREEVPVLGDEKQKSLLLSSLADIQFSYPSFSEENVWLWEESWNSDEQQFPPFFRMSFSFQSGEIWEKFFFIPTDTTLVEASPPE